ncbi:uncharacterized protein LOC130692882 isoform X1 [Daphnia carinata]|uniref:uncharacterized protein LOC130692882 isoform X1 n=2 Tax=Daphnia carinata TaxID=120202 RepID=UPI002868EB12|nr:uncharacterized protein LOC130692882 isoform X1 [Daphnia carinata]
MLPFTTCFLGGSRERNFVLLTNMPVSVSTDNQSKASFTFTERPAWNKAQLKGRQVTSPSTNKPLHMPDLAEESKSQSLERQVRPCWSHSGRFLTLHKRRKKRPPTRAMTSDQALLDDLYHGPTHVLLARISEWPFNAFALDRATGGRPLPTLCFHLFHHYGLMAHFHLDPVKVWKFFSLVEEGYHSNNPYHNAIHAADVTQAMHCFLQEEKMRRHLTPLEIAASLIAAMAHDLDHPGVNQPFLVATSNHLASLYKNASVLENHHWRSAMACLMESGMMDGLERTSAHELQRQIQSLILATDIARQQEFLSAFQGFLNNDSLDMRTGDHRHFMLQIALKCADICNPCRPWEVSRAWSLQVSEEFYRQGDLERRLGLSVTPLCDRYTSSVSKIQTGFFRFIAAPLFEEWHRFQATPLSWSMLNYLRSNKLKWDSILNGEETGDASLAEHQLRDPAWSELGVLEMGIEKIHLRRASLPVGRSGLWTSNTANSSRVSDVERSMEEDGCNVVTESSDVESHPLRSLLPVENHDDSSLPDCVASDNAQTADISRLPVGLPARLPHRRESLPFNFPDRSRPECFLRQGRRESLPTDCSRTLNASDVLPELNITSMAPLPWKKEKRASQPNCVQPATSVPSTSSDPTFGCADEKENIVSTAYLKTETSRLTLRRGSAPTALHPLNWLDSPRSKRNSSMTHFGRQGSLRLTNLDQSEPGLRRRGSLPYELGRKLSGHDCIVGRLIPETSDCAKIDVGVRRGSAPSDLLRNTGASIASCWIQLRDRVKMKGKEIALSTGTGLMNDSGCGLAVRECRRRSLRRRRSGGPELFASVVRRSNNFPSAQLPPLPQSATCTHAKLKQRTSSLSPPESINPIVGSGDCHRDWLLLGRRGSGALELLAGLWRQNRDRSERSSFESDDSLLMFCSYTGPHRQRLSMDSSSSSDGIPCSALEEYCHLVGHGRTQRRGSCPTDHSVLSGSSSANLTQLNSR